jgi:hypothetical protein
MPQIYKNSLGGDVVHQRLDALDFRGYRHAQLAAFCGV